MNNVKITDMAGQPKPAASITRAHMSAMRGGWSSRAYEAAGRDHAVLMDWDAPFVSGHGALSGERETLAARVHDMVRNDGWVSGAVDKKLFNIVGTGFRLSSTPDWKLLNISEKQAQEFADRAEALWVDYSTESGFWADATRAGPVASVISEIGYHYVVDGEGFGALVWRDETQSGYSTAMQPIHPQRCSNPLGRMDTATLKDGVELDDFGAATGYWFSDAHPGDNYLAGLSPFTWTYMPRETEWGRPRVLHVRRRRETGMVRGVGDVVAFLRRGRQVHKLEDYELSAASVNSLLAAFIKTPLDPGMLADALDATDSTTTLSESMSTIMNAQANAYKDEPIRMGGGQVNFMQPGEDVYLTKPEHPNANFEGFIQLSLRNLAASMNMTAEQITQDWSQANYSSMRAAFLEVYKGFAVMTADLINGVQQPWYSAFLEECVDKGLIELPAGAPTFQEARSAWSKASWIGSPRGYIDPLKEVQATGLKLQNNLTTRKAALAEQGLDFDEVIKQLAHERSAMIDAGLDPDGGKMDGRFDPAVASPDGEGEEKSGAQQKRERQARRISRSGVPLVKRAA